MRCALSILMLVGALAAGTASAPAQPAAEPESAPFAGHRVVRVLMRSVRDVRTMLALSDDPWICGWDGVSPGEVDFRIAPDALPALRESGLEFRILIDDVQRLVDAERRAVAGPPGVGVRADDWYAAYQPLAAVHQRLDDLVERSGGRAQRIVIGRTVLDREIVGLRITTGAAPDGRLRPAIVINGCQHAREWITVMTTMHLAERLIAEAYRVDRTTRLVEAFDWYILPVVNADGYLHSWTPGGRMWRKNRRSNEDGTFGVDNNRNWDVRWRTVGASTSTGSETYAGTKPFSEPETAALAGLLRGLAAGGGVALHVDVHSYGQLILEPLGYDWTLPPDTLAFSRLSLAMQEAMFAVAGKAYVPGPTYRNIYPVSGGATDWTYAATGGFAMGLELRDDGQNGFVLPADQILPTAAELEEGVFAAVERLIDRPVDIGFVDDQPVRVQAGAATPIRLRVLRGTARPDPAQPVILRQRIGRTGPFAASALEPLGTDEAGPIFSAALIAGPCGSIVQYYFEVPADRAVHRVPPAGAARPFEVIAHSYATIAGTTAESAALAAGWLLGEPGDTTSVGRWIRGDPNGTTSQAEFDRTPLDGTQCFYTGVNNRGQADGGVGNGFTTLGSPLLNLAQPGAIDAEISAWVWFADTRGGNGGANADDEFAINLTLNANDAVPTWIRAVTLAARAPIAQATGVWRRYAFRVAPLGPLTPAARLRFIAGDTGQSSPVEAAVDDVEVISLFCAPDPCPADWNGSGAAGVQDIFDFLAAYFAGEPAADTNASGTLSVQDVFDFLVIYFTGC